MALVKVYTEVDGPQKLVKGWELEVRELDPIPSETDDLIFVDEGDLPVTMAIFAANFQRFEIVTSAVSLIGGESLDGRIIDGGDVDDTVPQTFNRANKVALFGAL